MKAFYLCATNFGVMSYKLTLNNYFGAKLYHIPHLLLVYIFLNTVYLQHEKRKSTSAV